MEEKLMNKLLLFCAITWSMIASWNTYRVFTELSWTDAQPYWKIVMDILWLISGFVVAISYWIRYVKNAKNDAPKDENGQE